MTDRTRAFYAKWARVYDRIARGFPGVHRWRSNAVDALDLDDGDRVLEVGVGTGANVPYLERAVGPTGRVVGVDLTREMLELADRTESSMTAFLEGDARALPFDATFDGVLATFVVGLFPSPSDVVTSWFDLVEPGGRLVLLDAKPSETGWAPLVNPPFRWFVHASSPGGVRFDEPLDSVLGERVRTARETLSATGTVAVDTHHAFDLVRVTAVEKPV